MNLVPFAGIAFLWFIGVLRDRLGQLEDRFFATVFFGSGLLFLGALFLASATVGGILIAFAAKPQELIDSATFYFARATVYAMMNIYVAKMACVFMITTSTIALYTAIAPRWLAILGYILAALLLFGGSFVSWSSLQFFPVWVFLLSISILADNWRRSAGLSVAMEKQWWINSRPVPPPFNHVSDQLARTRSSTPPAFSTISAVAPQSAADAQAWHQPRFERPRWPANRIPRCP